MTIEYYRLHAEFEIPNDVYPSCLTETETEIDLFLIDTMNIDPSNCPHFIDIDLGYGGRTDDVVSLCTLDMETDGDDDPDLSCEITLDSVANHIRDAIAKAFGTEPIGLEIHVYEVIEQQVNTWSPKS